MLMLTCDIALLAESPIVIVSPRFLNELRDKSDDVVSFGGAIEEVSLTCYTGYVPATTPTKVAMTDSPHLPR